MTDINDVASELEAMIDKHGLLHVLTGLELVCSEKAAHIRYTWQDNATARPWEQASDLLGRAARKITV